MNGELYEDSPLDDCWSVRLGGEYLCMLSWMDLPIRGGVYWEQRPADGVPDEYWGVSVGSGISLGTGKRRVLVDVAYVFEYAEEVMGSLLSDQLVIADSTKHQIYLSAIWHF